MALTQKRPDHESSFFSIDLDSFSTFIFVCTRLYVYNLSMFIQKDKKGRGKKSPFFFCVFRKDTPDRPLNSVHSLKPMRVDCNFVPCVTGHWYSLLPNSTSVIAVLVYLTSGIPLGPEGGSC